MVKKLTNRAVWHVHGGGIATADDRSGYDAYTTIGRYMIQPVSSPHNCQRHIGYNVMFCNEKGALNCLLYTTIKKLTTLPEARRLCQKHMLDNGGEIVPEQIPGSGGIVQKA